MKIFKQILILLLSIILLSFSCEKPDEDINNININYRDEMRSFVIGLSNYSKQIESGFIIIPQNGQELISDNGEGDGKAQIAYLNAIDATGRESMFYGYYNDDESTPAEDKNHLLDLCIMCEQNNVEVLATDYCSTQSKMDNSYSINEQNNFISFAADQRELNNIPTYPAIPHNENTNDITKIDQAQNFLYLINSENYNTKQDFINAVSSTNYDAIVMDLYHNEQAFSLSEINTLKLKANGGKRLVICYMSIGEAEDYRYYWDNEWNNNKPTWLDAENPDWEGNYKVKYWQSDWQAIIYGNNSSYLKKIIDAGFDGTYLDIIDGFEYFEEN